MFLQEHIIKLGGHVHVVIPGKPQFTLALVAAAVPIVLDGGHGPEKTTELLNSLRYRTK